MSVRKLVNQLAVGALVLGALSFGTVEAVRASAGNSMICNNCPSSFWCDQCCGSQGSICFIGGDCLCA